MNITQHRWVQGWNINAAGILFGGHLLSWADEDCTILAREIVRPELGLVTVGFDRVCFHAPSRQGDRLRAHYTVVHVGKTTITIFVKVTNLTSGRVIFTAFNSHACLDNYGKEPFRPAPVEILDEYNDSVTRLNGTFHWTIVDKIRKERQTDPR